MDADYQSDTLDIPEVLSKIENETGNKYNNISRQIKNKKSLISLLESNLLSKENAIKEACDDIKRMENELLITENRYKMAAPQLDNLNQTIYILQGVIFEKEKKEKSVKVYREKQKKHLKTVLDTHRQKWEAYFNFYESMPEAQNYLRLKSELVIAEEEMKSLKKTRQELEEETKMLNKDLTDSFYKDIVQMAALKCETIQIEKKIRSIIKDNKPKPLVSTCNVTGDKPKKIMEIPKKICFSNFSFAVPAFRTKFQNILPATPTIRSPVPTNQIKMIAPEQRNQLSDINRESTQLLNEFRTPEVNLITDSLSNREMTPDFDQTPQSQMTASTNTNSYEATPPFFSTASQNEMNPFSMFSTSVSNTQESEPFSFNFNALSPTKPSDFDFNFNFGNENVRFHSTPDNQSIF